MILPKLHRHHTELTSTSAVSSLVSSGRRRGVGRALAQDHVRDRQEGMGKERLKTALQVLFREQCDRIHSSEYQRLYLHTGGPQLRHTRTKGNGKVIESETERHLGLRLRATQQCVSRCALGPARLALALITVSTNAIRKLSAQSQNRLRHEKETIVHKSHHIRMCQRAVVVSARLYGGAARARAERLASQDGALYGDTRAFLAFQCGQWRRR